MTPSPPTLLIIEDDPTLCQLLKHNFEFVGYKVRTASDGRKGLKAIFELHPDLILLDIMLPEINGFDLCRRIRAEALSIPIIMLTAKSQESDIVRGLDLGADDYVTKPFSIDVLMARVNARLRRPINPTPNSIAFGPCQLDLAAHKLFRDGVEIPLTPKEYKLLEHLTHHAGRALTRQKILDDVWGQDLIVTERSVDRCINTLRGKIEICPDSPQFIKTIRDVGYRLDLESD